MINSSLELSIGKSAIVRMDVRVIIDCRQLVDDVRNLTGLNYNVTWYKNEAVLANASENNLVISQDKRLCIITATSLAERGESGSSGNYTCRVCSGNANIDCIYNTSLVCGKKELF